VQCAIIVADVTDKASFESIQTYLSNLNYHNPHKYVEVVVVGNKCDSPKRVVNKEDAIKYGNGLDYIECSAKDNINIKEAFTRVISKYLMKNPTHYNKRRLKLMKK